MRFEVATLSKTGIELECCLHDKLVATGCAKPRPAVIVLAGGAYLRRAHREGDPVAARFLGLGYDAFVLRYSTYFENVDCAGDGAPLLSGAQGYPHQVSELMEAIAYVRSHADELLVDASRVFVVAFSAGAHVALSLAERFDDATLLRDAGLSEGEARSVLPAGIVACYPMLRALELRGDEQRLREQALSNVALFGTECPTPQQRASVDLLRGVRPGMPPTFMWQTSTDATCSPSDTLEFARLLLGAGVSCELHLYREGVHGMALADESSSAAGEKVDPHVATWVPLADQWMRAVGDASAGVVSDASLR
ncbi:MAG: alpha/beta hydrolase [Tractidigestivibacter sp.]|jgi:acetyl esterase/lipase|uniref:alpha/beta hydrolase n=1 Tax=Tractidigestivibacter sp. TaxID=2847320 RepID=UPI003D8B5FC6